MNGKSEVNELSYLMPDVTEQLGFIRCLSVRYSENTKKEVLKRALEVTGHVQKGVPFYFNDNIMIPALISKGIIERLLDLTCSQVKKKRAYAVIHMPRPYKSLLTESCLESGRDFNDAGAV